MLIFLSKVEHKMRISNEWCVFNYNDDVEYSSILVALLQTNRLLNSKNIANFEFRIIIGIIIAMKSYNLVQQYQIYIKHSIV